jgi:tetratricopeptide (TPR) repeat protein
VGIQEATTERPREMTAGDWFAKGLELLHGDASQEALEALTTAIQLDPEYAEAYAYRGFAYYQQGNYAAAMEDYSKAVALWPVFAEVYYFRAILYGHLKDHEKAINDYTSAIELKPTLIDAYYFRALNQGAAGRYEEALRDMKKAAKFGYEPAKRFLERHKVTPERN